MIKINLLPVRAARKKENIRRQVSVFLLCVVFAFCVMGYLTVSMNRKISSLNKKIEEGNEELKEYLAIQKKVKQMRKALKRVEEKMDIIVKLEANRAGPVLFMDALTSLVISDKMWLTNLKEKGGKIELEGVATDNKTVADFMTYLEDSPYFTGVDLISSKQVDLKKQGRKFKRFSITSGLSRQTPGKKPKTS